MKHQHKNIFFSSYLYFTFKAFFFTTCPSICPIMNKKMIDVQNEFYGNPNFGIASFSITPDIDTPKVLSAYRKTHNITNSNWHMLTGKSQECSPRILPF